MRFKRFSAMLLALAMCMGVFSTTVFAYSDESATTTTTARWFFLSMVKNGLTVQRNPRIITWELARW